MEKVATTEKEFKISKIIDKDCFPEMNCSQTKKNAKFVHFEIFFCGKIFSGKS